MQEVTITHRDLEDGGDDVVAAAVIDPNGPDAAICNTIRNAIMGATGLNMDELDMDADGTVQRTDAGLIVLWAGSRGHQSVTMLS